MPGLLSLEFSKNTREASPKKRKGEDGASEASGSKTNNSGGGMARKMGENLDFRVRVLESEAQETFKINKDDLGKSHLFTQIVAAKEAWSAMRPTSRTEHPWGPERHSLGASMLQYLNKISEDDLKLVFADLKTEVETAEALATTLCLPCLAQQHRALCAWAEACSERSELAEWLVHLQMTETKKKDAWLLKIAIRSTHQFAACMPYLRFLLRGHKAVPLFGTAPKGPSFYKSKA